MTIEIFISYAHEDEKLMKKLEKQLIILQQHGYITTWNDRKINAGREWNHEINSHLAKAQIILLLISTDFMVSNYCYSVEVKEALKRHDIGECRVIPIILRPTFWKNAQFSKLQALPTNGKPVIDWKNKDKAFLDIAEGIQKVVEELSTATTSDTSAILAEGNQKAGEIDTLLAQNSVLESGSEPKKLDENITDDLPDWDTVFYTDEDEPLFQLAVPLAIPHTNQNYDVKLIHEETIVPPTLTIEHVKEKWKDIQKRVKTKYKGGRILALLNDYTVINLEGTNDLPIVVIKAKAKFHYEAMQQENRKVNLEWALKIELGQQCEVKLLPPDSANSNQSVRQNEAIIEDEHSTITVEQVKDKWELVKKRTRTRKDGAMIAAVLNAYSIVNIENTNDLPIVVLRSPSKFHYDVLQKLERSKLVEWALTMELNQECLVRLLPSGHLTPQLSVPPPPLVPRLPKPVINDDVDYDF